MLEFMRRRLGAPVEPCKAARTPQPCDLPCNAAGRAHTRDWRKSYEAPGRHAESFPGGAGADYSSAVPISGGGSLDGFRVAAIVPEPSSIALLAVGLIAFLGFSIGDSIKRRR